MNRIRRATFWSLTFFFGWLLSFPLHGPILSVLAASQGLKIQTLGLLFTITHAIGLLLAGFTVTRDNWKTLLKWSLTTSLLLSMAVPLIMAQTSFLLVFLAVLGVVSAYFVIGWSYPYVAQSENRVKFMAGIILAANLILICFRLIKPYLPATIFGLAGSLPLLAVFPLIKLLESANSEDAPGARTTHTFPSSLFVLLLLLILGVYISGGFMYNSILPQVSTIAPYSYFWEFPYLAFLAMAVLYGQRVGLDGAGLVYSSVSLMGLGYVFFASLGGTAFGLWEAGILILGGLALLDLFLWTYLGQVAYYYGHEGKFFGFGLSANAISLFVGGLLAEGIGVDHPLTIGLSACAVIFLTVIMMPTILDRLTEDLRERVKELKSSQQFGPTLFPLNNADLLTERENEIVDLIIQGNSNEEIARKLYISENTVKVHIKNINRKLGVSSKYELLSQLIKAFADQRDASVN